MGMGLGDPLGEVLLGSLVIVPGPGPAHRSAKYYYWFVLLLHCFQRFDFLSGCAKIQGKLLPGPGLSSAHIMVATAVLEGVSMLEA